MANPREYTCRLLEMVDSGILSADDVMNAAIMYMSDSDVEDIIRLYQWDDTIVAESTEEAEEDEITIGREYPGETYHCTEMEAIELEDVFWTEHQRWVSLLTQWQDEVKMFVAEFTQ